MAILNFKKVIAGLDLVTIASSPTILAMNYFAVANKVSKSEIDNREQIVSVINSTQYEQIVSVNSSVANLKKGINSAFIKEKLPASVRQFFKDHLFTVNKITKENGTEITQADLSKETIFNAKINYNYGHKKQQITNLKIAIKTRIDLHYLFSNFQFVDSKGVAGFLDSNKLTLISQQLLIKLNVSNLDEAGLILENHTSNSIVIKAKTNSKIYQGETRLTWKLKLFEIYGNKVDKTTNQWIVDGLRGYFYLDQNDNKIKFFDFITYFFPGTFIEIHSSFADYHNFKFSNQNREEKQFIFNGWDFSLEVVGKFGSFDFTSGVKVIIASPDINKVKIFNPNNKWEGLSKKTEVSINALGEIKQGN